MRRTGGAAGISIYRLILLPIDAPYVEVAKAAGQGDVATLEKLIKQGLDVDSEGKETKGPWGADTMTLLTWAALKDSAKGAEALFKAGADRTKRRDVA